MGLCQFKISEVFDVSLLCILFFLINIAPKLFSPFTAFDSADGPFRKSLFPFKAIRRHNRRIGITFTFFSLVFMKIYHHLFEFVHFLLDIFNFLGMIDSIWLKDRNICALSLDCFASEHHLVCSCLILLSLILFSL